jgi:hypothetical protein
MTPINDLKFSIIIPSAEKKGIKKIVIPKMDGPSIRFQMDGQFQDANQWKLAAEKLEAL